MNLCIVNRADFDLPKIKQLGADHEFSVIHDDEIPKGYAVFVFADAVVVRNLMTTKEETVFRQ